jgi:hypothetical protein
MNWLSISLKHSGQRFLVLMLLPLAICLRTVAVKAQPCCWHSQGAIAQATHEVNEAQLQKKAEEMINLFAQQDYAQVRERLLPALQTSWSLERLKQVWENQVLAPRGAFKRIVSSKVVNAIDENLVFVTTEFEKGTEPLIVTFNEQQQIVGLDFPETKSIEEIAQDFVTALGKQDYATARSYLHPYLKGEVFPQKVQQKWEALLKKTGAYQKLLNVTLSKGASTDATDLVLAKIQFAKVTENVFILFDRDKQIVGVDFPENN